MAFTKRNLIFRIKSTACNKGDVELIIFSSLVIAVAFYSFWTDESSSQNLRNYCKFCNTIVKFTNCFVTDVDINEKSYPSIVPKNHIVF